MVLAQNLRDAVLQAALQGKLTEQIENDSSVDIILQNIEKKNNTIIDINFEESFLKSIPSNWKYVRLGDLLFIARGGSPRPIQAYLTENENGVNWIKIGDTEIGGKYIYSTKEKIKREGMKKSRYVKEGDFLLTNSMSFGRPYILKTHGCIHDGWLVLSDESNCFIQDYLYWLLSSSLVFIQFSGMASGAVVKNLNIDKVKATIIPLPPIEEQQRIVDRVNELMKKIDDYEKVEKELLALEQKFPADMKNALLQAAMQGKLTKQLDSDSSVDEMLEAIKEEKKQLIKDKKIKKEKALPSIEEDEIPFDIPISWKWIRLSQIGEIIGGGTPKTTESTYWDNGSIPWITPADMNGCGMFIEKGNKSITKEGLANSSAQLIPKDSIVISSRAPIGYIAISKNELSTSQGCKTFSAYNKTKILSKYIYFVIIYSTSDLIKRATGTTFKEISAKGVGETIIPLPPIEEQQRIVERLEQLLPLCETL